MSKSNKWVKIVFLIEFILLSLVFVSNLTINGQEVALLGEYSWVLRTFWMKIVTIVLLIISGTLIYV